MMKWSVIAWVSVPLGIATWVAIADDVAPGRSSWSSDFGPVYLDVSPDGSVAGSYPKFNGTLSGNMTPSGALYLTWLQPTSEQRCNDKKLGTHYWGRVTWAPTDSDYSLKGQWSYCDSAEGSGGTWNASLQGGSLRPKLW
ncbi:MAG: hypothetical protein HQL60_00060 [Magnetococcales bacterium]|nr:hypothetical protein [Magnetococcales bacterium]